MACLISRTRPSTNMVPLARAVTLRRDSVAELFAISERTGYARLPVREGDRILGSPTCTKSSSQHGATRPTRAS